MPRADRDSLAESQKSPTKHSRRAMHPYVKAEVVVWQLCDESLSPTKNTRSLVLILAYHLSSPPERAMGKAAHPPPPSKNVSTAMELGVRFFAVWTFSDWSNQSITKSLVIDTLAYNPLE